MRPVLVVIISLFIQPAYVLHAAVTFESEASLRAIEILTQDVELLGIAEVAQRLKIDPSNLRKILQGKCGLSFALRLTYCRDPAIDQSAPSVQN